MVIVEYYLSSNMLSLLQEEAGWERKYGREGWDPDRNMNSLCCLSQLRSEGKKGWPVWRQEETVVQREMYESVLEKWYPGECEKE